MRVWAGGSMNSICFTITWAAGLSTPMPIMSSCSGVGAHFAENRCSAKTTSA